MLNPIAAEILSMLLPGLNQFAIGETTRDTLLFIFGILVMLMLWYLLGLRIAYIGGLFYGLGEAFDAFVCVG